MMEMAPDDRSSHKEDMVAFYSRFSAKGVQCKASPRALKQDGLTFIPPPSPLLYQPAAGR